jgi:antitoxin Phd
MDSWAVQDAKARFSELLEASLKNGPQIVTRRGIETAVLVPIAQWRQLQKAARPTLKELLLVPEPRFEGGLPVPRRGRLRRREALELE